MSGPRSLKSKPLLPTFDSHGGFPMPPAKCRVLVIDDHEDSLEVLKLLLGEEDYEVTIAVSIVDALTLARSQEFDLYVLDKHLPDGSGLDLCAKLVALTPRVPCIFYTGDAYEVHRREAMAAGADAYVAKPDIEGLIDNVHKLMANRECATAN
uniref:Putative two-component response regulator n=1 Tax=uncultured Acidobacteriota bacterium TaxID=171953 RepID=Q7X2V8_9BACT|nr:putative two-component response regulator [uncultured Acidobacteriota bacterium]